MDPQEKYFVPDSKKNKIKKILFKALSFFRSLFLLRSKRSNIKSKYKNLALIGLIVVAIGAAGFFYFKYQEMAGKARNILGSDSQKTDEASKVIDKVRKLTDLPDEVPTVATVTDVNSLSGQPFFSKAQNGDKVLIFTGAKRAILYRPSTNKIIEIGPVNLPTPTPSIAPIIIENGEDEVTPSISPLPSISPINTPIPSPITSP